MLKLLIVFAVGFASDFIIVLYYNYLAAKRPYAAAACNTLIFMINVFFIGLAGSQNILSLGVYLAAQNAGIIIAIWFSGGKIARRNAD